MLKDRILVYFDLNAFNKLRNASEDCAWMVALKHYDPALWDAFVSAIDGAAHNNTNKIEED